MTTNRPDDPGPVAKSVQDRYAPGNACFGCGAKNLKGLQLKSFPGPGPNELVARFRPAPHHLAFDGIVNGGIIGALLDCHSNWTAACALMTAGGLDAPPCTVTAEFHVKLKHPTPIDAELELSAQPIAILPKRVEIEAKLSAKGKVTATCHGIFVAVDEGHPAYHRW
jgi:acyl-coenzyme A thioesterase PaaI-like protein